MTGQHLLMPTGEFKCASFRTSFGEGFRVVETRSPRRGCFVPKHSDRPSGFFWVSVLVGGLSSGYCGFDSFEACRHGFDAGSRRPVRAGAFPLISEGATGMSSGAGHALDHSGQDTAGFREDATGPRGVGPPTGKWS